MMTVMMMTTVRCCLPLQPGLLAPPMLSKDGLTAFFYNGTTEVTALDWRE